MGTTVISTRKRKLTLSLRAAAEDPAGPERPGSPFEYLCPVLKTNLRGSPCELFTRQCGLHSVSVTC